MRVSIWEEDFSQVKLAIDEIKARGVTDFRRYLIDHPEFVERAVAMVKVVDVNDATVKLFGARSRDQLLGALHKTFTPESQDVFAEELIAIAEGQTSFESEAVLRKLNGDKLSVLISIALPPDAKNLDSVLVSIMDITERNLAREALQRVQAELAHLTRVATLGELTASIAHEINQPLAAVVTNAGAGLRWLGAQPPDLEETRQALGRIVKDGERASNVIRRIRALVKKAPPRSDRLDINEVILEAIGLIRSEGHHNRVSVQTELATDLPLIPGDRIQLQQVMLNLVINAIEAVTGTATGPREVQVSSSRFDPGRILVAVRDTGMGIDPERIDHVFDAFYTTKADGMGMGLAISRSIIESHHGRLWATAGTPRGATFQFTLPIDEEEGEASSPNSDPRAF